MPGISRGVYGNCSGTPVGLTGKSIRTSADFVKGNVRSEETFDDGEGYEGENMAEIRSMSRRRAEVCDTKFNDEMLARQVRDHGHLRETKTEQTRSRWGREG